MKHRVIVPYMRAGVTVSLLATGLLIGCSVSEDSQQPEPVTSSGSQTEVPRTQESPTPAPQRDNGPTFTPASCAEKPGRNELMRIDGEFKCMSRDEVNDYRRHLVEEGDAIVVPIEESLQAGASPEAALRMLVDLSCARSLDNPYYWGVANEMYSDILNNAIPDALATDWPSDFSVALKQGCFE